MTRTLDADARTVFRAVTEAVAPDAADLDDEAWARSVEIVETTLADRPADVRRQLRLFIRVLKWLPVLRWGRTFPALDPGRRTDLLEALQDAPLLLLRRGAWGLRTLALMGYYGLPEVRGRIGYRAHPRGWKAHRVRNGEARPDGLEPGPEVQL